MFARDEIIKTKKAGRKIKAKKARAPGARKKVAEKVTKKEMKEAAEKKVFLTHTEGHYVRTLSRRNLHKRVNISQSGRFQVMEHILQGRLDMCRNCQRNLIPALIKKYPGHIHKVHYSFFSPDGSRTYWKGKKRFATKMTGRHRLTRYNESPN
jgi:hypothetical protein